MSVAFSSAYRKAPKAPFSQLAMFTNVEHTGPLTGAFEMLSGNFLPEFSVEVKSVLEPKLSLSRKIDKRIQRTGIQRTSVNHGAAYSLEVYNVAVSIIILTYKEEMSRSVAWCRYASCIGAA